MTLKNKLIKENPKFKEKQRLDYNCGPTCMTYALSVCGWEIDQLDLHGPLMKYFMKRIGTLPTWFTKVANEYGLWHSDIITDDFDNFSENIKHICSTGGSLIVLTESGHWVLVAGYDEKKKVFLINDPAGIKVLEEWSEVKLYNKTYSEIDFIEFQGFYAFAVSNY